MARRDLTGAVDFGRLEAYAAGDEAVIGEVLALFDQQSELWMRLLEQPDDRSGARDAAHAMKGAALGLGADALAEACAAAEFETDAALVERRVEQVRDALARVALDVAAYRHERLLQGLKRPA